MRRRRSARRLRRDAREDAVLMTNSFVAFFPPAVDIFYYFFKNIL